MIGLYHPGRSPVHRLAAGWKLVILMLLVIGIVAAPGLWELAGSAVLVAALFGLARIPGRLMWQHLRPLRWVLAVIGVSQWLLVGWYSAVLTAGGLLVSVAAAALLTLTTTMTAVLDVIQGLLRPLHRFGIDGDRIGLTIGLTIRCIPLVSGIVHDVVQAGRSRGVRWSLRAFAAPVVVRALRSADELGEALVARGVDD